MPSIPKYRRTFFALYKEAGLLEEDRHWLQEQWTGKASTGDWTAEDWQAAIAHLQRQLGQHGDRHPHIREDRPKRSPSRGRPGHGATEMQCGTIERICDKIEWLAGRARGPLAYLKGSSLKGLAHVLRRAIMQDQYDQGMRGRDLWERLTREEASNFIQALKRLKTQAPAMQSDAK